MEITHSKDSAAKKNAVSTSLCHQRKDRSFSWKGKYFPLCARCTGIHAGYLSMLLFAFEIWKLDFWLSVFLMSLTYIDGWVQAFVGIESTNTRRFVTGLLSGIGTMSVVAISGKKIGKYLLTLF